MALQIEHLYALLPSKARPLCSMVSAPHTLHLPFIPPSPLACQFKSHLLGTAQRFMQYAAHVSLDLAVSVHDGEVHIGYVVRPVGAVSADDRVDYLIGVRAHVQVVILES